MCLAKQGSAATGNCSGGAESREIRHSLCPYSLQGQKAEVIERTFLVHTQASSASKYGLWWLEV